jgi:antitoxin component YwqK of YwqJK toxin-antitoxin module
MIPGTAFAKKKKGKGEVPTAGKLYYLDQGKWQPTDNTFTAVVDKAGKVTSVSYTNGHGSSSTYSYEWRGENLVHVVHNRSNTWDNGSDAYSFDLSITIRKKKPAAATETRTRYENGKLVERNLIVSTFRWNKKDGSQAKEYNNVWEDNSTDKGRDADIITIAKNRRTSKWNENYTYTYYKNGALKTVTRIGRDGREKSYREYDANGYLIVERTEGDWEVREWQKRNYTWTFEGKTPKSVEIQGTGSWPDDEGTYTVESYAEKWEFTATQPVKKVRNCDSYGIEVWNGIELDY